MKKIKSFIYSALFILFLIVPLTQNNFALPDGTKNFDDAALMMVHRVGAKCCDGTNSSATGRGACSHHGGVKYWKMSDGSKVWTGRCD